jgi:histidinol-phosphate aminotransferase
VTPTSPAKQTGPTPKPWLQHVPVYSPGRSDVEGARTAIKLSSNENPWGPSPLAKQAYQEALADICRYPDSSTAQLRARLGAMHGICPDSIVCGAGSEELIAITIQAFAGPGDEVVHCAKGFIGYAIGAVRNGARPVAAAAKGDATDVDAILEAVSAQTRMVCIANPNNPTGSWMDGDELRRLHCGLPANVVLLIDEAYAEYAPADSYATALPLAASSANVIVTRTFSKAYGLAALRVGWAAASEVMLASIKRLTPAFSVGHPAQLAACAALEDRAWLNQTVSHTVAARLQTGQLLAELGLDVTPSATNFLLVRFASEAAAARVDTALTQRNVLVRPLPIPGLRDCLRITIGLESENLALIAAMQEIAELPGGFKRA